MRAPVLTALLLLLVPAVGAAAPAAPIAATCARAATAEARIAACNARLKATDLSSEARAVLLANRGFARLENDPTADAEDQRDAFRQAVIDAGDAVKLAPSEPLGHVLRGTLADYRGDRARARADFDVAAGLTPIFETFAARGRLLRLLGERDAALADLNRAVVLGPDQAAAYFARGRAWRQWRDYPRALQDFAKAIELDPAAIAPRLNYGGTLESLDRTPEAIAIYDALLANRPYPAAAYAARAEARRKLGDMAGAVADGRARVRVAPKSSDAWVDLGSLLMEAGQWRAGYEAYAKAGGLSMTNVHLYNERCWWRAVEGRDHAAALADCQTAMRLSPTSLNVRDSRGFARFHAGDLAGALSDMDAVLRESATTRTETRFMRGVILRAMGRTAEGDADIAASLAKQPGLKAEYEKYRVRL